MIVRIIIINHLPLGGIFTSWTFRGATALVVKFVVSKNVMFVMHIKFMTN